MPTMAETNELRKRLQTDHGAVLTTAELQYRYEVKAFAYGLVVVKRKSDGVSGVMSFSHMPRFYFDFIPTAE